MKITTKKLVLMAIFVALGIILPIVFHIFGSSIAQILSPMHIPVFIAGALMGPIAGLIVGMMTPILSSLFTGMPPVIPMLPIMFVELAIYGYLMGYLYKVKNVNIYLSLIITMLLGRISTGIVVYILVHGFNIGRLPKNPLIFVQGTIISGMPGIILHLALVPLLIKYLRNANFLKRI
ncbi:MAG TPA: ECF transporter S component [Halanaerobiales bacterium]|nr:ECF transporter S component [Halanaerobiales bacterium]